MRSCDYAFLNVLRILVKMLFVPIAFQSSKNLRWSSTFSVVVGARKKVFKMVFHLFCCCRSKEKVSSIRFFNESWHWDSVLTILASIYVAIECKKWLNSLATLFFFSYKCMNDFFQTAWCKFRLWIEINYFFYPLPNFKRVFLKRIFKMWFLAPSSEICYEIFISFI